MYTIFQSESPSSNECDEKWARATRGNTTKV